MIAAGTRLGPYEILSPLGAGGMGEVYRARDSRLSREVAIKVLPASFSNDADRLRRFEQEAKAAGILNHPNITAVYDIGSHEGAPYVVSELLEGETLRAVLAGGRVSPRKAIDYATADGPRTGGRAREGDRPPGPEAREPLRHEGRPVEDPRLRPREADAHRGGRGREDEPADGDGGNRARSRPRNDRLHGARAGARTASRRPKRHLLLRRDPLRDALGPARVSRRLRRGHDVGDPPGGSARPLGDQPEPLAGPRADRPALPREEPRAAVSLRSRSRVRPRVVVGALRTRGAARSGKTRAVEARGPRRSSRCRPRGRRRGGLLRRAEDREKVGAGGAFLLAADVPAAADLQGALRAGREDRLQRRDPGKHPRDLLAPSRLSRGQCPRALRISSSFPSLRRGSLPS